jgi:hypothetical protein
VAAADRALRGPPGRGERQPDAAPVGRVGMPLHQAALGQPLDQPGQGRLAEQDVPVELGQPQRSGVLGQRVEHVVLAHGHVGPRVLGRELLHHGGVGGQQRLPRVVREVGLGHHSSGYSAWNSSALSW